MTQSWSGQASAQGWSNWRLPSEVGQSLEAVRPEGAMAGASAVAAKAGQSAQQSLPPVAGQTAVVGSGPASPLESAPSTPPAMFAPESLGPNGWQRDDYQSYLMLTGGVPTKLSPGGAPQSLQPARSPAIVIESDDPADSQRLAQESIEVLNRVWPQFDVESMSRPELNSFISESRIGGEDRATLARLVEDEQAFNWLDRLGGTFTDGRITRATVAYYAVGDVAPAPLAPNRSGAGKQADADQSASQESDTGADAKADTNTAAAADADPKASGGAGEDQGNRTRAPAANFELPGQGPGAAAYPAKRPAEAPAAVESGAPANYEIGLFEVLSRNFGILDQAAPQSADDRAVTRNDLTSVAKSAIIENQSQKALARIAGDKARFDEFDLLDGDQDGRITWEGLRKAEASGSATPVAESSEGSAMASLARLPNAPNAETADYSPIFFAGASTLGGEDWQALFGDAGAIDLETMRNADNETLRELANDPLGFKQIDSLDGNLDGRISQRGLIEATQPSRILFDTNVKGEDGKEVPVLTAVHSGLGKKYESFELPGLPEGVNNDNGRAYRAAFALADNLNTIAGDKLGLAATDEGITISVEDIKKAASDQSIIAEDRAALAEITQDAALFDWMCGVGEGGDGSSIPVDRLAGIVSDWNRANFNELRVAYGMLNSGVEGLAKGADDPRGFQRGMSKEEVSAKVLDPAALTKAYNRMMSDPAIQADMTEALQKVLPDAKATAEKISKRLESEFYVGYTDWLRTQENSEEISARVGSEIHTLKLLDPELGTRTGDVLSSKLILKQAQTMGAQADEQLARDVLKLMLTQLPTTGLREARTLFRLTGNTLSAIQDIAKAPAELNKLVDAMVPRLLRPWQTAPEAPLSANQSDSQKVASVMDDLTRSGFFGTVAAGFGAILGAVTIAGHANDGRPNTLQDRLTDALVILAPASYGNQVAKTVNYALETLFDKKYLSDFTKLASKPVSELISMLRDPEYLKQVQLATENLKVTNLNLTSAALTRGVVAMLDMAGGAVAAALGVMQINRAKDSGDNVDLASGALLTAGGGLWLLGGVASLATTGLAAPFFVLSGVTAFAGLVAGWFKDPAKDFAQKFGDQLGSLDAVGAFRPDWRENVQGWFNANYVDDTTKTGLGLDL